MTHTGASTDFDGVVTASWRRCEHQYGLLRNATKPIMRIRSSEIGLRLEDTTERIGGRLGIFRRLSDFAAKTGQCLVLTDANGILVRLAAKSGVDDQEGWHGIALGSRWDEKIAGTNGVSMAMQEGSAFTVRGKDHFYSRLKHFACTAVPLVDAENEVVGFLNLAMIDREHQSDYLLAQQVLENAANRIQRILFEKHFGDSMIVSISPKNPSDLLKPNELVAIDPWLHIQAPQTYRNRHSQTPQGTGLRSGLWCRRGGIRKSPRASPVPPHGQRANQRDNPYRGEQEKPAQTQGAP